MARAAIVVIALFGCVAPQAEEPRRATPESTVAHGNPCADAALLTRERPGLSVTESRGTVLDGKTGSTHEGCRVEALGEDLEPADGEWPHDLVRKRMASRDWQEEIGRAADGAGSTAFALRKAATLCLFSALWMTGTEADPEALTARRYRLEIGCFEDGEGD